MTGQSHTAIVPAIITTQSVHSACGFPSCLAWSRPAPAASPALARFTPLGADILVLQYRGQSTTPLLSANSLPVHASSCAAGLAGAWIGLTIQHCGNHGAMSTSPAVNKAMGLTDDLIGGSSLMWRYHHQASICSCNMLPSYLHCRW